MKAGHIITVIAAVLVLVVAGVAIAGLGKRFAHGGAKGQNPVVVASGSTQKPHVIRVRIRSRPSNQKIGAQWATECAKGTRAGTRGNGFRARTPVKRKLRLRFRNPDACNAWVKAAMKGFGRLKIDLYAKRQ
jgi:hypothetical protein